MKESGLDFMWSGPSFRSKFTSSVFALVQCVTECHLHVLWLEEINQNRQKRVCPHARRAGFNTSWKVPSGVPPLWFHS